MLSNQEIIVANNVYKTYQSKDVKVEALKGVSLSVNQGEIVIVDQTKELLKRMGHKKLTVELQEQLSEIPNNLAKYNLEIGRDKMSINYTYNVQAKQTGITNLLQDLKDEGLKLKDLKTEQSTLEKIFVSLVKENNEI